VRVRVVPRRNVEHRRDEVLLAPPLRGKALTV
jgi:hypothetical protein